MDVKPEVSQVVRDAIIQAFPNDHQRILPELKWDGINGNWWFNFAGMYVGVETDGYVHT